MRKLSSLSYLGMLACAVLFLSCQDEEKSPVKPGDVRFTIRSRSIDDKAGRTSSVLPEDGILFVSVLKATGEVVFNVKEIPFTTLGDYVVSEPVLLPPGDYVLSQFVMDGGQYEGDFEDGVYVAPVEGSEVSQWVDDPLPIPFTVSKENLITVEVQVLPFYDEIFTPEDFGYVTFGIDVAPYPYFKLAVFKPGPNGPELDPVHAYLLQGADTIVNSALPPGTHEIAFVGDRSKTYTLVLEDEAYGVYAQSFVLNDLLHRLNGAPWTVTMKPALTMVWGGGHPANTYFSLHVEGERDNLFIDWGDGSHEELDNTLISVEHDFGSKTPRVVCITGDLAGIDLIEIMGPTTALYLDHLTEVRVLAVLSDQLPDVLDVRKLTKLTAIGAPEGGAKAIWLSHPNQVKSVDLQNSSFTSRTINEFVHAIYSSVLVTGLRDGFLNISNNRDMNPRGFMAPPSAQALEEMRILRDDYGWRVIPEDF